jgi:FtsZ-binding cell division protein ZapB
MNDPRINFLNTQINDLKNEIIKLNNERMTLKDQIYFLSRELEQFKSKTVFSDALSKPSKPNFLS